MKGKRLIIIIFIVLILLLIPLIAMQFTDEVNWTIFDFVLAAVLLSGTGLLLELALWKIKSTRYKIAICVGLVVILCLIWVELAVGIFG